MTRYCHECNEHLNPCEDELCDLCNGLEPHRDDCRECYRPINLMPHTASKLAIMMLSIASVALPSPITRQLPSSDPTYQQAIEKLQQCAALSLALPSAKQTLATKPPPVYFAQLPPSTCAQYRTTPNIILLNENKPDACPSPLSTFAHELLHFLAFDHPKDPDHIYTSFDDVHVLLKSCLGPLYTHPSRFPTFPSLSPFSRHNSLGPSL